MMGFTPRQIRSMTVGELLAGIDGFKEFHTPPKDEGMPRDRFEELMFLYPDEPPKNQD